MESYIQQLVPNNEAMGLRVSCNNFHQNLQVDTGHQQKLTVRTDNNHPLLRPVLLLQQPGAYQWGISSSLVNFIKAKLMTVEQTAEWIKSLCVHRGWKEADAYAFSFKMNNITGCALMRLNHEILKFDLDMPNHKHRLFILTAIRLRFPWFNYRGVISAPTRLSHLFRVIKKQKSIQTSSIRGFQKSVQDNHGMFLHRAPQRGGWICLNSMSVQNNLTKSELNHKFGVKYSSLVVIGESKYKLDGRHHSQFTKMRHGHGGNAVHCH